jgi:hypothetical protein
VWPTSSLRRSHGDSHGDGSEKGATSGWAPLFAACGTRRVPSEGGGCEFGEDLLADRGIDAEGIDSHDLAQNPLALDPASQAFEQTRSLSRLGTRLDPGRGSSGLQVGQTGLFISEPAD